MRFDGWCLGFGFCVTRLALGAEAVVVDAPLAGVDGLTLMQCLRNSQQVLRPHSNDAATRAVNIGYEKE